MKTAKKTTIFARLKQRWNIKSNCQLVVILLVFSVTGTASVFTKKYIMAFLGIAQPPHFIGKLLLFIFITLPAYQVLLLFFGFVFGQFKFFYAFEKRMFSRFGRKKSKNKELN